MHAQTPVKNDNWGLSFTPPAGTNVNFDGTRYKITGDSESELMLVFRHDLKTTQELISDFQNTSGQFNRVSDEYYELSTSSIGYYLQGTYEEIPVFCFVAISVNPYGKGAAVMILVSNDLFQEGHAEVAAQVATSLTYAIPVVNTKSDFPQWQQTLSGRQLIYYESSSSSSGGYYSRERNIWLYADNTFSYSWVSQVYTPGLYVSPDEDSGQGHWRVAAGSDGTPILELNLDDGRQFTYYISNHNQSEGSVSLGNEKHLLKRME